MPCFSRVETKLKDLEAIQAAAEAAGITVELHSKTHVTVSRDGVRLQLTRRQADEAFDAYDTSAYTGRLLRELTAGYATARVKAFAKKRGYMVSRGATQGEFVLTSYR